ncbi:right-handed parallel beta-helix repeat-containing protein [Hymenobacter sp. BRD128]|uniref:right-handed parallel beta-helix repeat-containing protein n=1 Tax=Hymenobacter sp. BRD128 TaxID=2675878 RepID=UPI00156509A4|nr:right-handed parallel beta-helix repeat-containing protein [Hymenobacter sp. BRD128]QKG58644.1 right-handed parallel beta-helix repeat-containing protein [Hymenobacter sp. BRD128]
MKKHAAKVPRPGCWLACHTLLGSLLVLLASGLAHGQAAATVLRKDLKKDFGAVGDGRTNDHAAFRKAADFFNQRAQTPAGAGRAVLTIPKGTYLVGQPEAAGQRTDLLHFVNCRNLSIEGADSATTEIRYADSLRYGAFDPITKKPYEAPTAYFVDASYAASLGSFLVLQGCDNVEVTSLAVNGNSGKLRVGGHWGDTGIQLGADGVFINGSRHITLRRLALHHFGRDGIQVLNHLATSLDSPALEDILLENSTFDYNGRQGLSLTSVNGFRAVNCSFSHTGRVPIPALGRPLYSNPGAGVDVEPEGGYVTNVRLERCRLVDNAGQGLVSDRYGDGPPTAKHIVLSNCLLWGLTNWSVWVRQTDFLFQNCRIYGAFITGCGLAAYPTRFVGCTFEDRPYRGQPAYGQFLLFSLQEARAMSFTNCRFVGTRHNLLLAVPAAPDSASRFQLRNCTFELSRADPPLGAPDLLAGAVLAGEITFTNNAPRAEAPPRTITLGTAGLATSVVLQAGSRLRLGAGGSRYVLPAGLQSRPGASIVVEAANELVLAAQAGQTPTLYIGPGSRIVVRKGGLLELQPHTRLVLAGELVVEEGARFYQDPLAQTQLVGRGRLRVAANASRQRPN